jgi:hypothetical protein
LPNNGRPVAAATGENTASFCAASMAAANGEAPAASAAEYALAALARLCVNWLWNDAA